LTKPGAQKARNVQQSVPVIVIGNDERIIKGFNQEKFENALKEVEK
jgi:hypothetical protein